MAFPIASTGRFKFVSDAGADIASVYYHRVDFMGKDVLGALLESEGHAALNKRATACIDLGELESIGGCL